MSIKYRLEVKTVVRLFIYIFFFTGQTNVIHICKHIIGKKERKKERKKESAIKKQLIKKDIL